MANKPKKKNWESPAWLQKTFLIGYIKACRLKSFISRTRHQAIREDRKWITVLLKEKLSRKDFGRIIKELFEANPQ